MPGRTVLTESYTKGDRVVIPVHWYVSVFVATLACIENCQSSLL